MSFQNKASGIVIDAILTDKGRKYMANGKFKITKFALGDDEMDYAIVPQFNETAELTERDTPAIFEAFSNESAAITHGLLAVSRADVLYIPYTQVNTKLTESIISPNNEIFYIAVNDETGDKLLSDLGNRNKFLVNNELNSYKLIIETGLEIPESEATSINATHENKKAYILNMDLYDKYYNICTDFRFIDNIYSSPTNSTHRFDYLQTLNSRLSPLEQKTACSLPSVGDNFETYIIEATDNEVYYDSTIPDETYSMFNGPRSTIFALNLKINNLLTGQSEHTADFRYSKFGTINSNLFGSGNLYDFIETTIYIEATTTGAILQIPLRITRFSGSW